MDVTPVTQPCDGHNAFCEPPVVSITARSGPEEVTDEYKKAGSPRDCDDDHRDCRNLVVVPNTNIDVNKAANNGSGPERCGGDFHLRAWWSGGGLGTRMVRPCQRT